MTTAKTVSTVQTKYEREVVGGRAYHRVIILLKDVLIPAPFLDVLKPRLQDEDFAFGVLKGRLTFLFKTKHDAQHFQACLREIDTAN